MTVSLKIQNINTDINYRKESNGNSGVVKHNKWNENFTRMAQR